MFKNFGIVLLVLVSFQTVSANFDICKWFAQCNLCTTLNCCWDATTSTCGASTGGNCTTGTGHSYNCPVKPPNRFVYTDDFGRNKVLPFIAATNGNLQQAQTCLANRLPEAQLIAQYEESNCSGIVALNPTDKAIIVAYRGSKGLAQFLAIQQDLATGVKVEFPTGGMIFGTYNKCFFDLWNAGIGTQLQSYKNNPVYADYGLWVFGHSLGGSLASLTSGYAVKQGLFRPKEVRLVTTGATRTGNLAYAQGHSRLVPNSYRIVNVNDVITKQPAKPFLDASTSYHHRFEVWYPTNMLPNANFKICRQAEDISCSASSTTNGSFHNNYFNVPIDTWVGNGCQY